MHKRELSIPNANIVKLYKNYCAVGSTRIELVNVTEWKIVKSFSGHATMISNICFSDNGEFLFSAAEQDRFISQWFLKSKIIN